jgi:hypothetical protein
VATTERLFPAFDRFYSAEMIADIMGPITVTRE